MDDDGEPVGQVAEQRRRVETERVGDDLDEHLVADLVAVAKRAVDDAPAPVLREAFDIG